MSEFDKEFFEEIDTEAEEAQDNNVELAPIEKNKASIFAKISLVFGVLSLISIFIPLAYSSLFPFIAIIFAIIDKGESGKMSKQSVLGLVFACISFIGYMIMNTLISIFAGIIGGIIGVLFSIIEAVASAV